MLRGRGRGSFHTRGGHGGRGAMAARRPPAERVKRSVVPAFPVVSRGEPNGYSLSVETQTHDHEHTKQLHRGSVKGGGADDAPPIAVSARRGPAAAAEEGEYEGFIPPSASRGRGGSRGARGGSESGSRGGRGSTRGRRSTEPAFSSRGRGRGGSPRPPQGGSRSDGRPDAHGAHPVKTVNRDVEPHEPRTAGPTRVITTVTASGTEIPKKLNTKVFIDGLPYTYPAEPGKPTLEDEVLQFASAWKVGKPLRLIKKPGQGFGFLVLQSPNSVATAVRVLNGRKFLGRTLRVEEPKPKDLEKMHDIAAMKDVGKDSFTRQVLLTDLAKVAQPEIIREVLRDVAPQLEKRLEAIKMTSQNRKAFLTFETEADVEPAVTFLDGFHLLGRRISAAKAAAPGSLPYSHGGAGSSRGVDRAVGRGIASTATAPGSAGEEAAEEDVVVVPLGMAAAPLAPSRTSKSDNTRPRSMVGGAAALVASSGTGSNVTGRTEKYNLLDDGPRDVYVGNVGEDATEAQLRQHFAPCGAIRRCDILVHPETHLSTGIAHIEFALPAYAAYAQERYHGSRLRGCVLRVDRGETASHPLAVELPPAEEEDDYDEDAFMARYGVKDKNAYFKGTSVAAEVGADPDFDDEYEDDDDTWMPQSSAKQHSTKGKRERSAKKTVSLEASDAKRQRSEKSPPVKVTTSAKEDDSDDEEHFFDADTVPVSRKGAAGIVPSTGRRGQQPAKKNKFANAAQKRKVKR